MTALPLDKLPKDKMTVDQFLAWSQTVPGRYELQDGRIAVMQSQRTAHADAKFAVQAALKVSIDAAGLPCRMLPDGMTVRIDDETAYEPDALVYCGARLPRDAVEVPKPVVVVEVLSPSTGPIDKSEKLVGYFRVPSVMHYMIVNPVKLPVVHHARQPDGTILTRLVASGTIVMNPPGIEISVDGLLDVNET